MGDRMSYYPFAAWKHIACTTIFWCRPLYLLLPSCVGILLAGDRSILSRHIVSHIRMLWHTLDCEPYLASALRFGYSYRSFFLESGLLQLFVSSDLLFSGRTLMQHEIWVGVQAIEEPALWCARLEFLLSSPVVQVQTVQRLPCPALPCQALEAVVVRCACVIALPECELDWRSEATIWTIAVASS